MSRIGRLPVVVPSGVQVNVQGSNVHIKGPKGEMKRTFSSLVGIALENNQVVVTRNSDNAEERALHGTTRAVLPRTRPPGRQQHAEWRTPHHFEAAPVCGAERGWRGVSPALRAVS